MSCEVAQICVLRSQDIGSVLELVAACAEAPAWSRQAWESFLQDDAGGPGLHRRMFAVRASGQRLAGLVAVTLPGAVTELELVLVHPGQRRNGIGCSLLSHWLEWAAACGATEALLEVRAANEAARQLYVRLGFREDGRRPRYYQQPVDDAIMMSWRLADRAPFEDVDGAQRAAKRAKV